MLTVLIGSYPERIVWECVTLYYAASHLFLSSNDYLILNMNWILIRNIFFGKIYYGYELTLQFEKQPSGSWQISSAKSHQSQSYIDCYNETKVSIRDCLEYRCRMFGATDHPHRTHMFCLKQTYSTEVATPDPVHKMHFRVSGRARIGCFFERYGNFVHTIFHCMVVECYWWACACVFRTLLNIRHNSSVRVGSRFYKRH